MNCMDNIQHICAFDIFETNVGRIYLSNRYPIAYIPISKNASTWAKNYFSNTLNWKLDSDESIKLFNHNGWCIFSTLKFYRKIVILRDPIDRWISGIIQYFYTYVSDNFIINDEILDYFFAKICFDHHTMPQVNFLHNLQIDTIDFFMMNENLEHNLNNYLFSNLPNEYIEIPNELYKNKTSIMDKSVYDKIKELINTNPKYRNKITNFYKLDYQLINSVKFYEAN